MQEEITVRDEIRASDVEAIARLHANLYEREYGWDRSFEEYVRQPLEEFLRVGRSRGKMWLLQRGSDLVGCIAIVEVSEDEAQLRWFLVASEVRGRGWGKWLLDQAIQFCREQRYHSVTLATVSVLTGAAKLYEAAGFRIVVERPVRIWGADLIEQQYRLFLQANGDSQGVTSTC